MSKKWSESASERSEAIQEHHNKISELQKAKQRIGEVRLHTFETELTDAFQQIGTLNKEAIQNTLKFRQKDAVAYEQNWAHAIACLQHTQNRIAELEAEASGEPDSVAAKVAAGLRTYFKCLQTWADGAIITLKEAWFLQIERFGCQTILVRGMNGEVNMAHTEEWGVDDDEAAALGNHASWSIFDTPEGKKLQAFTGYPAAMPGSSFCMTEKTISAVDSIEHREDPEHSPGIPAAVTTWLCWYLGDSTDALEIIKAVGRHDGGYALNQIYMNEEGKPEGRTIEFVDDEVVERRLGKQPLQYKIHTNRIKDRRLRTTKGKQSEYDGYYRSITHTHNKVRAAWLGRDRVRLLPGPGLSLQSLQREIGLVPFAVEKNDHELESSANSETIATFVASMDVDGTKEGIVSAGPLIPGRKSNALSVRNDQSTLKSTPYSQPLI